jgi:hypothetical protein
MRSNLSVIGTWVLKSFVTEIDDGSILLPYGDNPQGRIVYTDDGFMSAHLWNHNTHVEGTNSRDDSVLSAHMRCMMTASLRATATTALRRPFRRINRRPQLLISELATDRIIIAFAAA